MAGVAFVLGFVGWTQYYAGSASAWPISTRVYITLQLFTFDSGSVEGPVPIALQVARYLAPVSLATAAFAAVATVLQRTTAAWRTRAMSGHLVVVGLGDRGLLIALRAAEAGMRVVAIESDSSNPHISVARRAGITTISGDARTASALATAGVHRAERLISVAGALEENAGVAQAVLDYQRAVPFERAERFSSFIEPTDTSAMHTLQTYVEHERVRRRQEFFNLEDRAGPAIVDRYAPLTESSIPPAPVVAIGATQTGISVLAAAARRWEASCRDRALRSPGVTSPGTLQLWLLVPESEDVDNAAALARALHPELAAQESDVIALHVHQVDPLLPELDLDDAQLWPFPPGLVVVATDDETLQLRVATTMRARLHGHPTTIVVTTRRRQGLVSLLEDSGDASRVAGHGAGHGRTSPTLAVFAINEELCSDGQIRRGRLDAMARAMHEGYLRDLARSRTPEENASNRAYVSWDLLPEDLQLQNDAAAQALWDVLTDEGYVVIPRSASRAPTPAFPDDVLERLAHREHVRWFRSKHPSQPDPSWDSVDPVHQEQTRDQVRRIPDVLAAAGLQLAQPLI